MTAAVEARGVRGLSENESDASLIERTRRGDHQAFEELVRRYQAVAFRVAYLITGSAVEAEDAAQDAFVRAYQSIDRFRPDAPFRPWLLQIVANAARTRRGRVARQLALNAGMPDPTLDLADGAPSPEALVLAQERASELLSMLDAMRPEDQQVIALRYFVDLSEAEMADALGCPRGTVKSRLSRALGRLRSALDETSRAVPHA
jgi:RNA polymerase sigma-70 factor (ECF subfamily)